MPETHPGPKIGPGAHRPPEGPSWRELALRVYLRLLKASFVLLAVLLAYKYLGGLGRSAWTRLEDLVLGPPAEKVLPKDAGREIEAESSRGRRAKDEKFYAYVRQKLEAAKAQGRDTALAEKKLADAAQLIQHGDLVLAERLLSELNFYLTSFPAAPARPPSK